VNAVDMGHYDSEKLIMGEFKRIIEEQFGESITVELFGSSTECMRVFSMDTP
jgi:putative NIF3 family GTP cyclohydrolase 1 type 2